MYDRFVIIRQKFKSKENYINIVNDSIINNNKHVIPTYTYNIII